jgi:ribosomal protein S18 acetylase RimI-like enzyme
MSPRQSGSTTAQSLTVRAAAIDDTDVVLDHWHALVEGQQDYGEHIHGDANRLRARERLAETIARGGAFVAVTVEDAIEGFVTCGIERGYYDCRRVRGQIRALYVAPGHRGTGVGTRLLDTAEKHLLDRGCETILVDVLAANDPAREFYRDHGFSPHRLTLERRPEVETTTNTSPEH